MRSPRIDADRFQVVSVVFPVQREAGLTLRFGNAILNRSGQGNLADAPAAFHQCATRRAACEMNVRESLVATC
jgi:hypothetical protein